jgi:hypothetical protein
MYCIIKYVLIDIKIFLNEIKVIEDDNRKIGGMSKELAILRESYRS